MSKPNEHFQVQAAPDGWYYLEYEIKAAALQMVDQMLAMGYLAYYERTSPDPWARKHRAYWKLPILG